MTRDDVARAAGVSVATVSYVLNGGPRRVSEEKRQLVLSAVAELGYRPNAIARSLRARRTRILGLVLPDSANPYFAALSHSIEEAAEARGYQVMVANAAERPEREAAHIEALLRLQVDGLFWIPADLHWAASGADSGPRCDVAPGDASPPCGDAKPAGSAVLAGRPTGVPTVQVDRSTTPASGEGGVPGYDVVEADNVSGGRLATEHLLRLGHRRIACLAGPAGHRHAQARLQGFREAVAAWRTARGLGGSGAVSEPYVAHGGFDYASGATIGARWCTLPAAERPTGIVCGNDAMAIGALSAIARAGLRVPLDVSITGYDDLPQAVYAIPPLTTVAQPAGAIAAAAVERLLSRIEHPEKALLPVHTVLPVRLIVRESTAAAAAT